MMNNERRAHINELIQTALEMARTAKYNFETKYNYENLGGELTNQAANISQAYSLLALAEMQYNNGEVH
jgi:hypothetical protein